MATLVCRGKTITTKTRCRGFAAVSLAKMHEVICLTSQMQALRERDADGERDVSRIYRVQ